jgi:hypothetical protein
VGRNVPGPGTPGHSGGVGNAPYDLLKDHDFLSVAIGVNL